MLSKAKLVSLVLGGVMTISAPLAALAKDDPSHSWVYENGRARYHDLTPDERVRDRDFSTHDHHEFHGRNHTHSSR